jgi:hypothetical protein
MASVRPSVRLTADETGELDLARAHLHALVCAAQRLVGLAEHDPDVGDCGAAGCRLAAIEHGPTLCALAQRLSLLDAPRSHDAAPDAAAPHDDPERALADFRLALMASLDAVRTCRSVGHAEGRCWFSTSPDADGCGEVLRAAHLTG